MMLAQVSGSVPSGDVERIFRVIGGREPLTAKIAEKSRRGRKEKHRNEFLRELRLVLPMAFSVIVR